MTAPLFTELGLLPLHFRRVTMALRLLRELLDSPESELAKLTLDVCVDLHSGKHGSWLGDIQWAVDHLPRPLGMDDVPEILKLPPDVRTYSAIQVDEMIKEVTHIAKTGLQLQIDSSYRTYLLWNRLEPLPPPNKPAHRVIFVRHYLRLRVTKHRKALTRLLLSDPPLALEQLRRADRYHPFVPRDERLCRLCGSSIESPEHAILLCEGDPDL
ncbi:hypothetical protein BDZ89DRAFT_1000036, partial [Hymenopellis radicata]